MSERNKQVARRFIGVFETGETGVLNEVVVEDVIDHNPLPGQKPGRDGLVDAVLKFRIAFPDMRITITQQVSEGDLVVQTGIFEGTNSGELFGMPATNKTAVVSWMDMYRMQNDKIVEAWHIEDVAGMLQQLGLMPGG
jgi:steroid delta-isomerase-like uncharacterized protein